MHIEKSIGHEIHVLANLIHRFIDNSPAKQKIESVTGTNAWIIGYIAQMFEKEQDVFQRDLEKKFGITRSTASKVVNLMVQKGLIERVSVPSDARLKKLVLTDKSWEIYELMKAEFHEMEVALSDGFSEEEIALFFSFIRRMENNMKVKGEKNI